MADKPVFTLGAKHALDKQITATITLTAKMTRRYIWMLKLKYIWAVIRAKVNNNG